MPRIRFISITPSEFFYEIRQRTRMNWRELGEICEVHPRSFSDWKNGKYLMPRDVFEKLIQLTHMRRPKVKIFIDYWHISTAAQKGALARYALYGNPATAEGRSRGGRHSQQMIRANPELAAKKGIVVRKSIQRPRRSIWLSEVVGILLGDGGISKYQAHVTLNSKTDLEYATYVSNLFQKLFNVSASLYYSKHPSTVDVVASSRSLVEFLTSIGLVQGNKIRQQIDIPPWIFSKPEYMRYCLRGLMDTDGCFYVDHHQIRGKEYLHSALAFTSYSPPLYNSVTQMFKILGYHPTGKGEQRHNIFLRREKEILRYFQDIGSSNPKHLSRFANFLHTCRM